MTCPEGENADVMLEARAKINLADIGIEAVRPRRGVTGALLLEITGEGREIKADARLPA